MSRFSRVLAACALVLFALPAAAQDGSSPPRDASSDARNVLPAASAGLSALDSAAGAVRTPSAPTAASSVAGVRVQRDAAPHAPAVAVERVGRNPALMIVGGAALIVGSIIGGDSGTIIMLGGATIGLIGLWNFLR